MREATDAELFELELLFGQTWNDEYWTEREKISRKFLVILHEQGDPYAFGNAFVFLETDSERDDLFKYHYYCNVLLKGRFDGIMQIQTKSFYELKDGTGTKYPEVVGNNSSTGVIWKSLDA